MEFIFEEWYNIKLVTKKIPPGEDSGYTTMQYLLSWVQKLNVYTHPLFQIEKNRSPKQTSYSTFTDRRTTDCFDRKQNFLRRICWLREKINSIGATNFDGQKFKWITNEFEQIFPTDTKHYFFLGSAAACPWASGFDQPNLIIKINCHCHCS